MVIYSKEMVKQDREKMRGGDGTIVVTHHAEKKDMKHCRLFCEMNIPPGGSVGEHDHVNETEYYFVKEGIGIVVDDGVDKKVGCGDMIITGGGASHSIRNMGTTPLVITAVIITDVE